MRVMCVLLPHFALSCEVLRQPAIESCPTIMTCTAGSQRLVFDYSPGLEGLQRGMPLQQALSRHGSVELIPADIPHYWSAFDQILDSLEGKSPLVEGSDLGCAY
ncbi:MAG: hypothetical protein HY665_03705, partial [Chloroflexi bacterium]|nr:hypothetical protein [Chloroflexota bacterium]